METIPLEEMLPFLDHLKPREAIVAFEVWFRSNAPAAAMPTYVVEVAKSSDSNLDLVVAVANHAPGQTVGPELRQLLEDLYDEYFSS